MLSWVRLGIRSASVLLPGSAKPLSGRATSATPTLRPSTAVRNTTAKPPHISSGQPQRSTTPKSSSYGPTGYGAGGGVIGDRGRGRSPVATSQSRSVQVYCKVGMRS